MLHLLILSFLITCEASTLSPNCTNNSNIAINCTIETGGAEVECPQANVIRVVHDYQNFYIHCQSYEALEFQYDGTKPTEAIRINTWVDVSFGNESDRDPKVTREHIKVEVLSVSSLIEEYKKTLNGQSSNLSVSPAIYYSRSGEFRFNPISGKFGETSLNFSIFFEEPQVDPSFIHKYERNGGFRVKSKTEYFVGCPSTHYDQPDGWEEPELWINAEKATAVYEYDPTAGFTVASSIRLHERPKFQCVMLHKTNRSKNVLFDPTLKTSGNDSGRKIGATSSDLWSFFSHGGNFQARCNPENSTLYFIGARNPDEQVLVRDFVLPDLANRSLYVERGRPNEDKSQFLTGIQTHRGTSLHFGALYCQGLTQYNLISFVNDIKGQSSFLGLNHSVDWTKLQGMSKDPSWPEAFVASTWNPEPYMELKSTNAGRPVYDFENLTFQCHVHPFFLRPVVWKLEQNQTVMKQVEKDRTMEASTFTTQLSPGHANISCLAAMRTWRGQWAQITTNITVLASKEPKFEPNQPKIYEFAPDAKDPQVKLVANGVPSPNITCNLVLLGKNASGAEKAQAQVDKMFEPTTHRTEATFVIKHLRDTQLNCEARNRRGFDNITINIRIKSNGTGRAQAMKPNGAGRVHGICGVSFLGVGIWWTLNIIRML